MLKKLDIEIELPDGSLGTIHIEGGDDPEALARLFVAERCINHSYIKPLTAFIQEALERIPDHTVEKSKRTVESMNEASARLSRPFSHQLSRTNEHTDSLSLFTHAQQHSTEKSLASGGHCRSEVFTRLYNSGVLSMKKRQALSEQATEQQVAKCKMPTRPNFASERLYRQALEQHARVERNQLEQKRLQEELPEECTFKPAILNYSKRLDTKDHVIQRLTVNAPTAQKTKLDRLQRLAEEEALKECTFKPSLSTTQEKAVSIKAQYKIEVKRNGASTLNRLTEARTKTHSNSVLFVPTALPSKLG
ncbi:Hypothetical protein GLP15_4582 [Giardia lamblia P15]|uniref:Uncharacterized protein n=1 Tax=Giardia intestinalis (strain P15) TaxID=658858 RepID=E1F117_GIAIA|nr:Hypothetical protein GLP15_4582 [Giardia lamblia P15]